MSDTAKQDVSIRIPGKIHKRMLDDLRRPHSFAYERIGFLYTKSKMLVTGKVLVLAVDYRTVDDDNYIEDEHVGAKINSNAIRAAMQNSINSKCGCFHVHLHDHSGMPSPSQTDRRELPGIVESLANIAPSEVNGYLILSNDSAISQVSMPGKRQLMNVNLVSIIGDPLGLAFAGKRKEAMDVYSRQSFLGYDSQFVFGNIRVGIIGYGGGGSHIGLQLAHLGIGNLAIFDPDIVEDTNLNRLVGAWASDAERKVLKTEVARRVISNVCPTTNVYLINKRWQEAPDELQACDVIIGCVDSYGERQQVEAECRRYLIPYIDIGMDVYKADSDPHSIVGQVILSMPGGPCLTCLGYLTDQKLAKEAAKYGKVGGRPQVVWPNGVLASTAVGMFVNLVTNWTKEEKIPRYLMYDGNTGFIQQHPRGEFAPSECNHYLLEIIGPPVFVTI